MEYRRLRIIGGHFTRSLRSLAFDNAGSLHAAGDSEVKVFDAEGNFQRRWKTARPASAVAVSDNGAVYVGEQGLVEIFDRAGKNTATWTDPSRLGDVTAIGLYGDNVYVADAADRCIRRYTSRGVFVSDIGKDNRMKGFLIPNGSLDLSIDRQGIIHAPNPGKHRVERYAADGRLLGHIGRFDGLDPAGFPGCCNPTNVAVDALGRIYVTEKAGPRAKVLDADGNLLGIVADRGFDLAAKNMPIAVDPAGRVYVADTARLHIVVFEPGAPRAEARAPAPLLRVLQ